MACVQGSFWECHTYQYTHHEWWMQGDGEDRLSDKTERHISLEINGKIDTYVHYWTYLDDIADSSNTALREGFEEGPRTARGGRPADYRALKSPDS